MAIFSEKTGERLDDEHGHPLKPEHVDELRGLRKSVNLAPDAPPVEGKKHGKPVREVSEPPPLPQPEDTSGDGDGAETSSEPPAEPPHGAGPEGEEEAAPAKPKSNRKKK